MVNFPALYPYAVTLPELWVRYLFAGIVYVMLGIASWLLLHRFIFNRDWKAFAGGLLASSAMILWSLTLLPYLRFFQLSFYLLITGTLVALLAVAVRALWVQEGVIQLKEKGLARKALLILAAATVVGISVFTYLEHRFNNTAYQAVADRAEAAVEQLKIYQEAAAVKTKSLAEDPEFVGLFKQKGYPALTTQAQEVLENTPELDALAITDENGFTVVAPHNPLLLGADLTTLGPAHFRVLKGEPQRFLEQGISAPLVIGAGTPIQEGEEVIGGIFSARLVNRDLAIELAKEVEASELGIFCECGKLYVSTFRDYDLGRAVQNFLELAFTDAAVMENGEFTQNILLKENSYTLSGKILTNGEGKEIGILAVFEPYPPPSLTGFLTSITILAATAAIALFISPLVIHRILR